MDIARDALARLDAERAAHEALQESYADLNAAAARLQAEVERCRKALEEAARIFEQTHTNYCKSAWTDRGLHASECLLCEAEEVRAALEGSKP